MLRKTFLKEWLFVFILFASSISAFGYEENLYGDEIFLEETPLRFDFNSKKPLKSFRQSLEEEPSGLEFQKGGVVFFSNSRKELNEYMTNDFKSQTGATLNPNGRLSLTGGLEVKNSNPNASINSKKMYLTPSFRLKDNVSFTFANKYNNETKIYENELGLKYSPKFFKNTKFGISTGGKFDEENLKSKNLKFSTDLFIF